MLTKINNAAKCGMIPELDKDFIPAVLWDREFKKEVNASGLMLIHQTHGLA